ncbi:MAG: ABC transporter ATP-binding protein [Janthinobacterium lividum]
MTSPLARAAPQTTSRPRLQVQGVVLAYGNRAILRDVSLSVAPGELVALLGASGSGKSTLLRVIAGLLPPTAGQVRVDDQPLSGPHPGVALAFQDACLLPWLNVRRNVAFGQRFKRQPRRPRAELRARVSAALEEVGLAHAHALLPRQLSGGMAQRVALARCLARQPHTLLLDEPFGALDEVTRADMQRLLCKVVRDTNAATVLVTHDIDEALLVADRIVLLGRGGAVVAQWRIDVAQPREQAVQTLGTLRIAILEALHAAMRGPADPASPHPPSPPREPRS